MYCVEALIEAAEPSLIFGLPPLKFLTALPIC